MLDVPWNDSSPEIGSNSKYRQEEQAEEATRDSESKKSGNAPFDDATAVHLPLLGLFSSKKKGKALPRLNPINTALKGVESVSEKHDTSNTPSPIKSITTVVPINALNENEVHRRAESEGRSNQSTFSGWTRRSANTNSTWSASTNPSVSGRIVQELSPTSYVSQSTEVTVSSRRGSLRASEQLATVVHISAAGSMPIQINDASPRMSQTPETFNFPISKSQLKKKSSLPLLRDDVELGSPRWPTRHRSSDSWRPPEDWNISPVAQQAKPTETSSRRSSRQFTERRVSAVLSELAHLRRAIRRMDAATSKIILQRLTEEWTEAADASVYKELELEKQLWMLTALRNLRNRKLLERVAVLSLEKVGPSTKVLSLYENHASASFLAALSPHPEVHHLAVSPLSPRSYPNVHPLSIPGPISCLPYASSIFTSINAMNTPSLLPSSSIPDILKECQRILIPDGSLHLTLLDPTPVISTLGPCLRTWLENHLLINLERHFRCVHPVRLIPIWLADAELRGNGSTISTVRFYASSDCSILSKSTNNWESDEAATRKQQMKTQIGRMLWKEIWGGYVEGDRWWWDDMSIVEECDQLGTAWDCSIVEAVKE